MEFAAILLFYLGCVFLLISVHEFGHYLAGRIGGISGNDLRIRLLAFPQHVQLRSGEDWVSPTAHIDTYVQLVWEYLGTKSKVYLYVAGGFLGETLFTVSLGIALILWDHAKIAYAIVGLSLVMGLPWLILDPIMILRGRIFGDISGLWFLNRALTIVFVLVLIGSRITLLWWAS